MVTWARVAVAAVAGVVVVIASGCLRYFRYAYGECHPTRATVTAEEQGRARASLPDVSNVSFLGQGGITLHGWLTPPKNGNLIVLVHGLGGNRASLLPEAELFARHGFGSLLFDSRAHGESGGAAATWGYLEAEDTREAINFALSKPGVEQVALLGFSVGASAAARAAAEDPRVKAIVLYATWTSLREENAYKTGKYGSFWQWPALLGYHLSGVDVDAIAPIRDVPRFAPRPLLMIAGLEDKDTPPDVMARLFGAAGEPKEMWREAGVGHGDYLKGAPGEYERRVLAFLRRAMTPR